MPGHLYGPDKPAEGRWELASSWPPGRRSRTRMSSLELDGVLLVAVRTEDTAHRARRGLPTCDCSDCNSTYPNRAITRVTEPERITR